MSLISVAGKIPVVLDSCVIFPMPLCDTLLRAAEAGLYRFALCQEILDGATRNLVKKQRMTESKAVRFQSMIKQYFPEVLVEVPQPLVEAMPNHPGDRHVLATAIVARADLIVTFNLKHFPKEALSPYGIEAVHPDVFLTDLHTNCPDAISEIICQQANDLSNPPMSVPELLAKLDHQTPCFTAKVRFKEFSKAVVLTARKMLSNKATRKTEDGVRLLEGENYRLWQQGTTLTITAKDGRGIILRAENNHIEGDLTSEDIARFQDADEKMIEMMPLNLSSLIC